VGTRTLAIEIELYCARAKDSTPARLNTKQCSQQEITLLRFGRDQAGKASANGSKLRGIPGARRTDKAMPVALRRNRAQCIMHTRHHGRSVRSLIETVLAPLFPGPNKHQLCQGFPDAARTATLWLGKSTQQFRQNISRHRYRTRPTLRTQDLD
jgi:hypothetical protein